VAMWEMDKDINSFPVVYTSRRSEQITRRGDKMSINSEFECSSAAGGDEANLVGFAQNGKAQIWRLATLHRLGREHEREELVA
jgi:hypothetical protein